MDIFQQLMTRRKINGEDSNKFSRLKDSKKKHRSESLQVIFGLPSEVLQKFRPSLQKSYQRKQKLFNLSHDEGVELGNLGLEYQNNLRKTIINQTRQVIGSVRRNKSFVHQNNYLGIEDPYGKKAKTNYSKLFSFNEQNSTLNTLNFLQKTIIKDEDFAKEDEQELMELQASKLPIIKKKQPKRRQVNSVFHNKYFTAPIAKTSCYKQEVRKAHEKSSIQLWGEKEPICGWDSPDLVQF